jgi:hypothetical protein
MIGSGSRSQVRPPESFKPSRFGLLAIASFITTYPTGASCPRSGLIGTYTSSDCYDAAHKGTNTHARHLRHILASCIVRKS